MKVAGVYTITHDSGKLYVGSSVDVRRRWQAHRRDLRRTSHPNRHLQAAWSKHGESAFTFAVVEECAPELLIEREQWWIDTLRPFRGRGFNLSPSAYSLRGFTFSPEQRAKVLGRIDG